MQYYRLAQQKNTLPLHWCYGDAWDYQFNEDKQKYEWVDNRTDGFQVFGDIYQTMRALHGGDVDGIFSISEYPQLLILDLEEVWDGCSIYFASSIRYINSVKSIDSQVLFDTVYKLYEEQQEQYDYDSFEEWVEDSEEDVQAIIDALSTEVPLDSIEHIETLPCPELLTTV